MQTHPWQNRLYGNLSRSARVGTFQRHCAYMAAGWLSLFLVRPKLSGPPAASFGAIAGGGVLLVIGLVLLGPLLSLLQPAFRAAGQAPAMTWPVVALLGLFGWRYLVGRSLLMAFESASAIGNDR